MSRTSILVILIAAVIVAVGITVILLTPSNTTILLPEPKITNGYYSNQLNISNNLNTNVKTQNK